MRITKTQRLIDHMRAGDWSRALSLANTFRKLGTHRDTIRLACRVYPKFYRSLDNPGFCIACGAEAEGVEPDAEKYISESCGAPSVYGAEQLLIATF